MADFADLADAGQRLAAAMPAWQVDAVLAVIPNGAPAALTVAKRLGVPIIPVTVRRDHAGNAANPVEVEIDLTGLPTTADLVLVDDGVETGTAATSVARAVHAAGYPKPRLAVPVCARDAEYRLSGDFREIFAVVRPMATRSLHWHYAAEIRTDPAAMAARVAAHNQQLQRG